MRIFFEQQRVGEVTHGLSKHPLFDVWRGMIARCYNTDHPKYKDYGGTGDHSM